VSSLVVSLPPVTVHGKFLRRGEDKFLLRAMRLPGVGAVLDLSEKFTLRKRLDELAAANVNAMILTEAQVETVLSLASPAGLCAMVEVAIDSSDFDSPVHILATTDRIAKAVRDLRGYPALIGFLIDCSFDVDSNETPASAKHTPNAVRSALDAVLRTVRETDSRFLIALKQRFDYSMVPQPTVPQPAVALTDEDLTFASLAKIDAANVSPIIYALHEIADARPLVIEFGEELPGQDEVVARAFGCGAAGVAAPAMRRAVSSERQNIRMLSVGELLPFANLEGSSVPLPASTPMVSVVVTVRDDERTIAACLESISRLQYPNYEVIVIDDASRDRSVEIAAAAPGVRLMRQSSRAGLGTIRNAALGVARGNLIAFTRADCAVDADWLTLAVRAITEDACDAVSGPIFPSQAERGVAAHVLAAIEKVGEKAGAKQSSGEHAVQLADRNMLVRKSSLIAVGGFDARFIDEGGDRDLAARMRAAGMTLAWCPAGFVWRCGRITLGEFLRQRIRDGRAEAMLAIAAIGSFGAIAQAWARRHYSAASGSAAVVPVAPSGAAKGAARPVGMGNNRTHAVHPANR
jgi:GT2 family glycosyltransferase